MKVKLQRPQRSGWCAALPRIRRQVCTRLQETAKRFSDGDTLVCGRAAILALCLPLKELAQLVNFGCAARVG